MEVSSPLKSGVQPNPYDLRDYSNERTFGSITPRDLPIEYNADLALTFPDQNADGLPNGCTGYTQSETGQDENGEKFDPRFTYEKTLFIENAPAGAPVQMRDSFKSTKIFGLSRTQNPTSVLKRGAYFDVDKVGDYFDGARSALWQNQLNKRTLSCATPWPWGDRIAHTGMMQDIDPKNAPPVWHNYKICGWKDINHVPYLIIKAWCGSAWGDHGYGYMSREIFNKMLAISGTALYVQRNPDGADVQTVKLDILELILSLYQRLLALVNSQPKPPTIPTTPSTSEPAPPGDTSNRNQIYMLAFAALGKDLAPGNEALGCAESLSKILIWAGIMKSKILGTADLDVWLTKNLQAIGTPLPGDIIMSATGTGNGKIRGHCGVVGKNTIMSNNSATGKWDYQWTLKKWLDYYQTYGGIPTRYYRWPDKVA